MTAVITGVGSVSALGSTQAELLDRLSRGESGIRRIRSFDASTFPTQVGGEVAVALGDDIEQRTQELKARVGALAPVRTDPFRDRKVGFAASAAEQAWRDARAGEAEREASLVLATGLEQAFLEDFAPILERSEAGAAIRWDREADLYTPAIPPLDAPPVRFRARVDLAARAVAAGLKLKGPAIVNVSACAAGTLAIAHAASLIERGAASIVLCGATDSMLNPLGLGGMCRLGAPSPRNELDACRPFDRNRDGLVIGEGAAMFVVEDEARARARGARIHARILGWGSTQDAYRVTAPRPDGSAARRAMERALARAKLAPEAIGYINAHGTGTPLNDPAEAKAIRGAFGAHADHIAVSSIKGAVGHLMAAAGAIELAASLLAFERDLLPGTANHRELDPECPLDVIGPTPRASRVDALMSSSFGFGGQNAAVILGRPSP